MPLRLVASDYLGFLSEQTVFLSASVTYNKLKVTALDNL